MSAYLDGPAGSPERTLSLAVVLAIALSAPALPAVAHGVLWRHAVSMGTLLDPVVI